MRKSWTTLLWMVSLLAVLGGILVAVTPTVRAAVSKPLAPSSCNANRSVDGSAVDIAWTPANRDQAERYIVERQRNDGEWFWAGRTDAPAKTFTDDTLRPQDEYKFRVYTRRADGTKSGTRPCPLASQSVPEADEKPSTSPSEDQKAPAEEPANPAEKPAGKQPVNLNAGPVSVPKCGAYWGGYVNSNLHGGGSSAEHKLAAIRKVEGQMDRQFDIDHQFYRWDDFANPTNLDRYVKLSAAEGRIPFLSWKPVYRNGNNISWKSIAGGDHDALIREKAQNIKSLGMPVFVTFDHEADSRVGNFVPGNTGGGHIKTDAGSEAEYVAAWRHVHDVFAQEGVSNVSWVWVMTRSPFSGNGDFADRLYPGENYVDWVGLDPYNFFHGGKNWTEMETLMAGFTNWVDSRNIDKPWMLGEWGSVEDPKVTGRKGEWYRNAGEYIRSEGRLKAVVHFESTPKFDWRLSSSPSALAGAKATANHPHFSQTC